MSPEPLSRLSVLPPSFLERPPSTLSYPVSSNLRTWAHSSPPWPPFYPVLYLIHQNQRISPHKKEIILRKLLCPDVEEESKLDTLKDA
ncbi:Hypothetical predicted protein [Marmota monax]|uniref:Uncharacterized protein n=1 Tax=Marmota monax TaxID=9995 RepID=A0A5E4BXH4_MARMO|nr:Hypothetical predicted protein [Marmota monax]